MAETFLFDITEDVLSKVSSLALEEISLACSIKSEVKKLHNTLSTIKAVLLDANEQQTKNHELRDWLEKLRDAVYDADDLLDDLSTGISPQRDSTSVLAKVRRFFSCSNPLAYRFKIGHRISQIRKKLDEIAADRKNFHLTEQAYIVPVENRERDQTHSFVKASDIIGRDSDKEFVVRLLLRTNDEEHVSIIPIVGLGGLGKTTLVKLVYNDDRVVQGFDLKMWISVNEDFSTRKVTEKILRSATGETFSHLDMDEMQKCLSKILNAKRYLLVLDDVWNEDRNKWMGLKELLMNCSSGSKIIVTTRSKTVATIYSTTSPYILSGLSDDDCLSLFLKCAFSKQDDWLPNLVEIGKEIVKKCGGVPLAVKTLGSCLYMKTDEQEWLHIRDNDIWEIDQKQTDILPILRLSYEQMASYLRQCFAYCSMFPKGFEIPREEFINLWIAQGFIHSPNGNKQLENIGNQYFNELLSRFCFQDVVEAFDGEILACKIHNLVHDLAQSVAGYECLNVKSDAKIISDSVRHLYFHAEDLSRKEFPEPLSKMRKLRTFRYSYKVATVNENFIETITLKFRRLRVLVLNSLELEELPSSIGNLRKLRYLDLSNSRKIKFLPKSICKLVNLQTLNLINCEELQQLPRNIGNLVSLRTLYLTSHEISLRRKGPKSYNSLHFLLLYNCDFVKLPSEGFQHFTSLRVLRIYECQRLASLPTSIKYLTALEKLWIWNCDELDFTDGEGLEGLESLQSLLLMGLPKMVSVPVGLKETAAKSLRFVRIANCASLTTLAEWFSDFSSLQRLYVEDCPNLSVLPEGSTTSIFQEYGGQTGFSSEVGVSRTMPNPASKSCHRARLGSK
ncbi:unnamed protein product [Fraxinus pennsylvanica]|uniref:Disease resistance protein RGA3 n=1 Tax=Fraxinus pennsylvanica TaxID=56036 RepID=A0AAD2A7E1_9LAMI|nr:unnamed protein product [Fraxinus pennsylvanica]